VLARAPFDATRHGLEDIASLEARLLGGPCADLNLMTRRGAWHGAVIRLQCDAARTFDVEDADVTLLLAESGTWRVGEVELPPGVALLWRERRDTLAARLRPAP
jgi:environmental stress-induced protein Ves